MDEEKCSARCRDDFIRESGIGPELAEFLTEFIAEPGILCSMPLERRREFENRMDAVLLSFGMHF